MRKKIQKIKRTINKFFFQFIYKLSEVFLKDNCIKRVYKFLEKKEFMKL